MNPEEYRNIIARFCVLGYQEERELSKDGFLLLQKEEPSKQKFIIIGTSLKTEEDWKRFIIKAVLSQRNTGSPVAIGVLMFSPVSGGLVSQETINYLMETPWVEAVWERTEHDLVLIKSHYRWEIEEKIISLSLDSLNNYDKMEKPEAKEEVELYPPQRLTYILLFVNLIIFLIEVFLGGSNNIEVLIRLGAKYNPRIWMGESWRLVTPLFLHAGWQHFLFNSLALLQIGSIVERFFGKPRFLWLYFVSGIFGSVASAVFRPETISVGASGAIFGLVGALIYFWIRKPFTAKKLFGKNLWVMLGVNIVLGFIVPGIDYFGHLGGVVGGFLSAYAVGLGKKDFISKRWIWMLVFILLFVLMINMAITPPENKWYVYLEEGRKALEEGNKERAVTKLEASYKMNPGYPMTKKLLAAVYLEQGYNELKEEKLNEAIFYLEKSWELVSDYQETKKLLLQAYLYRAFNRYHVGEIIGAQEDCLKGLAIEDRIEGFHYILGAIYYQQNKTEEAISEFEQVLKLNPENNSAQEILEELQRMKEKKAAEY
jgi:membrane associated rhomboid family serine protease